METPFKISPNWGCVKTLDELITDSRFIFSHKGTKGRRPHIVLKYSIDGVDTFGLDYDRFGLLIQSVSNFDNTWGEMIVDSSKDCVNFIREFLIAEGAHDFLIKLP